MRRALLLFLCASCSAAPSEVVAESTSRWFDVDEAHLAWVDVAGNVRVMDLETGASRGAGAAGDVRDLHLAGSDVFWIVPDASTCGYAIVRAPVAGGSATTLVSGEGSGGSLAATATHLYWSDITCNTSEVTVRRVPLAGGEAEDLDTTFGGHAPIVADDAAAYWVADFEIVRHAEGAPVVIVPEGVLGGLAVGAGEVVFLGREGRLEAVPATGGEPRPIGAVGEGAVEFPIAVDDIWVYVGVHRVPLDGGAPERFFPEPPARIRLVGDAVYWSTAAIFRRDRDEAAALPVEPAPFAKRRR